MHHPELPSEIAGDGLTTRVMVSFDAPRQHYVIVSYRDTDGSRRIYPTPTPGHPGARLGAESIWDAVPTSADVEAFHNRCVAALMADANA